MESWFKSFFSEAKVHEEEARKRREELERQRETERLKQEEEMRIQQEKLLESERKKAARAAKFKSSKVAAPEPGTAVFGIVLAEFCWSLHTHALRPGL